jgi:NADPH-dependent F420 reductase
MKIGLIGGTGNQGKGLALRLAMAGHEIKIGSRSSEKAQTIIEELLTYINNAKLTIERLFLEDKVNETARARAFSTQKEFNKAKNNISGMQNQDAVKDVEAVLLTVPFKYAKSTLKQLLPHMNPGSILVDVTVPLEKVGKTFVCTVFPEGSGSKHLATIVPENIPVVAAFKTISAHRLMQIEKPIEDVNVFVCSDDEDALKKVTELANSIRNIEAIDLGSLLCARTCECMTGLLISMNIRHKHKQASFKVIT